VRSVAGSPWRGLGPFTLKIALASALSALAMVPMELWLGLDRPQPRLVELAGLIEVSLVGVAVLAGALGLLFMNEIRSRRQGQGVRPAPDEVTIAVPESARREGI
jgi:hypothetical protein